MLKKKEYICKEFFHKKVIYKRTIIQEVSVQSNICSKIFCPYADFQNHLCTYRYPCRVRDFYSGGNIYYIPQPKLNLYEK